MKNLTETAFVVALSIGLAGVILTGTSTEAAAGWGSICSFFPGDGCGAG